MCRLVAVFVLILVAGCAGTRPSPYLPPEASVGSDAKLGFGDASVGFDSSSWLGDQGRPIDDGGVADGGRPTADQGGARDRSMGVDRSIRRDQATAPCGGPCDDNDACTTDRCVKGRCVFTPRSCDDGDACTVDRCRRGRCSHKKGARLIYRYLNSRTLAHAFGPSTVAPAGFVTEAAVFRTFASAQPSTARVYQQVGRGGDHMLSMSASEGVACCGYRAGGNIGYAFRAARKGRVAVYRLVLGKPLLHLSSTSKSEGTQYGYRLEGITFYACPL